MRRKNSPGRQVLVGRQAKKSPIKNMVAVACLFNPCGWKARAENYRVFRKGIESNGIDLWTIEASWDGRFQSEGDRAIHIHANDRQVLWQKERMYNRAVELLPAEVDAVAFVDADFVFLDRSWPEKAARALESVDAVQLFSQVFYAGEERTIKTLASGGSSASGGAWAFCREFLESYGLYDKSIIGGGDTVIWSAVSGTEPAYLSQFSEAEARVARSWIRRVRAGYGFLRGVCVHLPHGSWANRRYGTRNAEFRALGYDPARDLELAENGLWQWSTEAPEGLVAWLRKYLQGRNEDE